MDDLQRVKNGFNAGYLLAQYDPALSKQILRSLEGQDLPYAEGYRAGAKEYSQQRIKELIESRQQDQQLDKDQTLDR